MLEQGTHTHTDYYFHSRKWSAKFLVWKCLPTIILSIDICSSVKISHNILPPYVHCDYPPRQKCIMNEGPLPRIDGHTTIILIFSVMSVISKHSQSTALPGNAFTISHIIAWKKDCRIKFWCWFPRPADLNKRITLSADRKFLKQQRSQRRFQSLEV